MDPIVTQEIINRDNWDKRFNNLKNSIDAGIDVECLYERCKIFCKVLKQYFNSPGISYYTHRVDNIIKNDIIKNAREGYWLGDVFKTYFKEDLNLYADSSSIKVLFDINGNKVRYITRSRTNKLPKKK